MPSKPRDPWHYKWPHREINENTLLLLNDSFHKSMMSFVNAGPLVKLCWIKCWWCVESVCPANQSASFNIAQQNRTDVEDISPEHYSLHSQWYVGLTDSRTITPWHYDFVNQSHQQPEHFYHLRTLRNHLTLKMNSTHVVETSVNVTLNSPSQDYTHSDDCTSLN